MKKIMKFIGYVLWPVLALLVFLNTTYLYHEYTVSIAEYVEKIFYAVLLMCFTYYFFNIAETFKKIRSSIITAVGSSLLYTVIVAFANNYWRYIYINNAVFAENRISFWDVFYLDITYTEGVGFLRYPALFFIALIVFGLKIIMMLPKVEAKIDEISKRILGCFLIEEELEEVVNETLEEAADCGITLPYNYSFLRDGNEVLEKEPYASFLKLYDDAKNGLDGAEISLQISGEDESFSDGFYTDKSFYDDVKLNFEFSLKSANEVEQSVSIRAAYSFKEGDNADFHNRRINEIKLRAPYYYLPNAGQLKFTAQYDNGYNLIFDTMVDNIEKVPEVCCSLISLMISIFSFEN